MKREAVSERLTNGDTSAEKRKATERGRCRANHVAMSSPLSASCQRPPSTARSRLKSSQTLPHGQTYRAAFPLKTSCDVIPSGQTTQPFPEAWLKRIT